MTVVFAGGVNFFLLKSFGLNCFNASMTALGTLVGSVPVVALSNRPLLSSDRGRRNLVEAEIMNIDATTNSNSVPAICELDPSLLALDKTSVMFFARLLRLPTECLDILIFYKIKSQRIGIGKGVTAEEGVFENLVTNTF